MQLLSYIQDRFVCSQGTMPNKRQPVDTLYCNQPTGINLGYAIHHKRLEGTMYQFKIEMPFIEGFDKRGDSYKNTLTKYT